MLVRPAALRRPRLAVPRRLRHAWLPRLLASVAALFLVAPLVGDPSSRGPRVRVPVATGTIGSHTIIDADEVRWELRASADLPDTPIAEAPIGARTLVDLFAGEVVTSARLAGSGPGLGSTLSPDQRAVAIPLDDSRPPLVAGASVDVVATFALGEQAVTETVVAGAVVLDTTDRAVTVVVPAPRAAPLIEFLATGVVKVVLAPPT